MKTTWQSVVAWVPLGMNGLLCLCLTLWVSFSRRPPDEPRGALVGFVVGAWGLCLLVSAVAWVLHRRLLRARRPPALLHSLVPPILAFLLFGSLAVGALATLPRP